MIDARARLEELVGSVLDWWKEHGNDSFSDGDDERSVFPDKPHFVRKAEHANVDLDISRNARIMVVIGSRLSHEPQGTYLVVAESEDMAKSMFFSAIEIVESREIRSGVFMKLLGGDDGKR